MSVWSKDFFYVFYLFIYLFLFLFFQGPQTRGHVGEPGFQHVTVKVICSCVNVLLVGGDENQVLSLRSLTHNNSSFHLHTYVTVEAFRPLHPVVCMVDFCQQY